MGYVNIFKHSKVHETKGKHFRIVYIFCGMRLRSGLVFKCEFRLIFSCYERTPGDYF